MTMSAISARGLRAAHDTDAKILSRKPKYELVAIYQSEGGYGGGTWSKDDLIGSILGKRYPIEDLNEAIHVIGHADVVWPDCPHCQAEQAPMGDEGTIWSDGHTGPKPNYLACDKPVLPQPSPAVVPTGTGWPVK